MTANEISERGIAPKAPTRRRLISAADGARLACVVGGLAAMIVSARAQVYR
jgi:hypothetical protein